MAQSMRPISTVTDGGNYTGATAHGSVDGTAPDTGDYWNGNDNQDDVLEVLLTDLSASEPGAGTCTVSIYETVSDTDSAPAAGGGSVTYDLEVYQLTTQIAARTGITPTDSTFTLDSNLTFNVSAITDWADVRVRFTSYGSGGAPGGRRGAAVSYIDISTPDTSADTTVTQSATTALTLATLQATVANDSVVTQSATTGLTLATLQATVAADVVVTQSASTALTLATNQATVANDTVITQGATTALTLATFQATVDVGSDTEVTQSATTALTLTENQATVVVDVVVTQGATTALTLTENQATVAVDVGVNQGTTTALTLTENQATISLASAVVSDYEGRMYAIEPSGIQEAEVHITVNAMNYIITLTDATFKSQGTGAIGSSVNTQALIDGFVSDGVEANGWNNALLLSATPGISRLSDTEAQLVFTSVASSGYDITSTETITCTVPAEVLATGTGPIEASNTFDIVPFTGLSTVAASSTLTEASIIAGSQTITITLDDNVWESASLFPAQRQNIINGITSAQSETFGWNNEVRDKLAVTDVVRTSERVVTVTLPATAAYSVVADETITVTIPSTAMKLQAAIVATPDLTVTFDYDIIQGATTALTLTENAATVSNDVTVTQGATTALTLTGNQATVTVGTNIVQSATTALTLATNAASIVLDVDIIQASTTALVIATYTADVSTGPAGQGQHRNMWGNTMVSTWA